MEHKIISLNAKRMFFFFPVETSTDYIVRCRVFFLLSNISASLLPAEIVQSLATLVLPWLIN